MKLYLSIMKQCLLTCQPFFCHHIYCLYISNSYTNIRYSLGEWDDKHIVSYSAVCKVCTLYQYSCRTVLSHVFDDSARKERVLPNDSQERARKKPCWTGWDLRLRSMNHVVWIVCWRDGWNFHRATAASTNGLTRHRMWTVSSFRVDDGHRFNWRVPHFARRLWAQEREWRLALWVSNWWGFHVKT
jgi:hypothetical protein